MNDVRIAQLYQSKAARAKAEGHEFSISFLSYKNMMRAKYCGYTKLVLTDPRPGKSLRQTDRTIDRIDSSKGYIKGNVIVYCHAANNFKSQFEGQGIITFKVLKRMLKKIGV